MLENSKNKNASVLASSWTFLSAAASRGLNRLFFWRRANFLCHSSQFQWISLVAKQRRHTPPELRSISQNQGWGGWGSCVAGWCAELLQRVCAATAKRKRAIRTHIYEGLSGLMTSDVKERSDKIPPHPPIQSARWRKRQAGPTLTERKALERGKNEERVK